MKASMDLENGAGGLPMLTAFWYAAARSQEVTTKPVTRKVCGIDVTLYRQSDVQVPLDIRAEAHVFADGPQVQYRRMLREHLAPQLYRKPNRHKLPLPIVESVYLLCYNGNQ